MDSSTLELRVVMMSRRKRMDLGRIRLLDADPAVRACGSISLFVSPVIQKCISVVKVKKDGGRNNKRAELDPFRLKFFKFNVILLVAM